MKLEVGMYVKTNFGEINKIINYKPPYTKLHCPYETKKGWLFKEQIIKASHNIIDLIEVGDYVNGHVVIDILTNSVETEYLNQSIIYEVEDIKSIITKEQFESNEYVVE